MDARSKWLWIVTLANIAVAGLLNTPLAEIWPPLYILVPIGLALCVAGLRFKKGVVSRASRRIASVINWCAFVFYLVLILLLATSFGNTTARFLIPDGYEGEFYVVRALDGESLNKTWGGAWFGVTRVVTYRIPQDGILRIREPEHEGGTLEYYEYYYERRDGSLQRISSSIYVPKQLQEDKSIGDDHVGVFSLHTGSFMEPTGCVDFDHYYVGTKANLLAKEQRNDLGRYVHDHPKCK